MRLDLYLFEQGYTKSRKQAQDLIKNCACLVNNKVVSKNGYEVKTTDVVKIVKSVCPYVSRAGYKLEGAYKNFAFTVQDKVVLDIGSSTGGFTDFCLKNGAKKVYSVDVGTNQLDESLKKNKSVVSLENTDIRLLKKEQVSDVNFVVCDVSFISLTKISYKIAEFLNKGDECVVLIKPQFECGPFLAKKFKGVIKDENVHKQVICDVVNNFKNLGLKNLGVCESIIKGGDGNTEFVAYFIKA